MARQDLAGIPASISGRGFDPEPARDGVGLEFPCRHEAICRFSTMLIAETRPTGLAECADARIQSLIYRSR